MSHARKIFDAFHPVVTEGLVVAVERRDAILNRALKSFIDRVGNETQKVDIHLLLLPFLPVAPGWMGQCEVLSAGVTGNHFGFEGTEMLSKVFFDVEISQFGADPKKKFCSAVVKQVPAAIVHYVASE